MTILLLFWNFPDSLLLLFLGTCYFHCLGNRISFLPSLFILNISFIIISLWFYFWICSLGKNEIRCILESSEKCKLSLHLMTQSEPLHLEIWSNTNMDSSSLKLCPQDAPRLLKNASLRKLRSARRTNCLFQPKLDDRIVNPWTPFRTAKVAVINHLPALWDMNLLSTWTVSSRTWEHTLWNADNLGDNSNLPVLWEGKGLAWLEPCSKLHNCLLSSRSLFPLPPDKSWLANTDDVVTWTKPPSMPLSTFPLIHPSI